jgi:hypothetical protein
MKYIRIKRDKTMSNQVLHGISNPNDAERLIKEAVAGVPSVGFPVCFVYKNPRSDATYTSTIRAEDWVYFRDVRKKDCGMLVEETGGFQVANILGINDLRVEFIFSIKRNPADEKKLELEKVARANIVYQGVEEKWISCLNWLRRSSQFFSGASEY